MTPVDVLRLLIDGEASEPERWLLRVALLELAGIDVSSEALAIIGGCDVEKVEGVMAVLVTAGLAEPTA